LGLSVVDHHGKQIPYSYGKETTLTSGRQNVGYPDARVLYHFKTSKSQHPMFVGDKEQGQVPRFDHGADIDRFHEGVVFARARDVLFDGGPDLV
jgi:hypothetical protein